MTCWVLVQFLVLKLRVIGCLVQVERSLWIIGQHVRQIHLEALACNIGQLLAMPGVKYKFLYALDNIVGRWRVSGLWGAMPLVDRRRVATVKKWAVSNVFHQGFEQVRPVLLCIARDVGQLAVSVDGELQERLPLASQGMHNRKWRMKI